MYGRKWLGFKTDEQIGERMKDKKGRWMVRVNG